LTNVINGSILAVSIAYRTSHEKIFIRTLFQVGSTFLGIGMIIGGIVLIFSGNSAPAIVGAILCFVGFFFLVFSRNLSRWVEIKWWD